METNKIYSNILKGRVEEELNLSEGDVLFLACGEKFSAVRINLLGAKHI